MQLGVGNKQITLTEIPLILLFSHFFPLFSPFLHPFYPMPVKSLSLSFRRGKAHRPQPKPSRSESQPNGATTTPSSTSSCTAPEGNQDTLLAGIGLYKFVGSLGNGKFSRVVLAQHVETGKQVAIKV